MSCTNIYKVPYLSSGKLNLYSSTIGLTKIYPVLWIYVAVIRIILRFLYT